VIYVYLIKMANYNNTNKFRFFINLWKEVRFNSVFRVLLNYDLMKLNISGNVLDYGGGNRAAYNKLFDFDDYESINIDPCMEPTYLIAAGEQVPCKSGSKDAVICFNTLEHIFDPLFVLDEMCRVIKYGGNLYISTPFMYPIHADPGDYFRPTHQWYERALSSRGFEIEEVVPQYYGPFSSALSALGFAGLTTKAIVLRRVVITLDYLIFNAIRRDDVSKNKAMDNAIGYLIKAKKSSTRIDD